MIAVDPTYSVEATCRDTINACSCDLDHVRQDVPHCSERLNETVDSLVDSGYEDYSQQPWSRISN